MPMNDLEFVRQCAKGDKRSWDTFVEKYSRLIYSCIYSVLKIQGRIKPQDNINDLFQEIFVLLSRDNFNKLKTFQGRNNCSLATWLRQVAINLTIDYLRRSKPVISLDAEDEEGRSLKDVLGDSAEPIREQIFQKEKIMHLKDCIKKLDVDERYFLELYLNQGLDPQDIALSLGLSRPSLDMRKHRIIEHLRECFRGKGFQLDF